MKLLFKNLKEKEEDKYFFLDPGKRNFSGQTWSKSLHFEHSRNCHWQTILELRVVSHFSTFTFHPSRILNSLNIFPRFFASHAWSCRYGGAFRERYGENGTHSWHHSHPFPLESHLYIHFSSPLLSTHFSSPSFILWKPNLFFWFWAYHHFLRRKM